MRGFGVSYALFTTESVENGEASERGGWIDNDMTLREAIDELTALDAIGHIEPDRSPVSPENPPSSFTAYQGSDRFITNRGDDFEEETRTLFIPVSVTASTRLRIARLLGAR